MKNIKLITQEKYNDSSKFKKVADGIYKALFEYEHVKQGHYVTTFSITLEKEYPSSVDQLNETEDMQYPLEDVLDKYYAHVSEFIQYENDNPIMIIELCTQGWLDKMEELIKIAGKHVYFKKVIEEEKSYFLLVVE
jgi:hypothetical protein